MIEGDSFTIITYFNVPVKVSNGFITLIRYIYKIFIRYIMDFTERKPPCQQCTGHSSSFNLFFFIIFRTKEATYFIFRFILQFHTWQAQTEFRVSYQIWFSKLLNSCSNPLNTENCYSSISDLNIGKILD